MSNLAWIHVTQILATVCAGDAHAVAGALSMKLQSKASYFGRTTELVQQARPKIHIEAVVAKVVLWLFLIVGALQAVVVAMDARKWRRD